MTEIKMAFIVLVGVVIIDYALRAALYSSREYVKYKPAGLAVLMVLSLTQKKTFYGNKSLAKKQFFLSIFMIMFLLFFLHFLFFLKFANQPTISQLSVIIFPLLALPCFHFLYELIAVNPLSITSILTNFHLRGILSLILCVNMVFILINAELNFFSLCAHFILSYCGLLGVFYLATTNRAKTSPYNLATYKNADYLEPGIVYYIAVILEVLYCLCVVHEFFVKIFIGLISVQPEEFLTIIVSLSLLLMITTLIVSYKFYRTTLFSLKFYEDRALPVSFLLFGINAMLQTYFIK